jgi:hypothetical protein
VVYTGLASCYGGRQRGACGRSAVAGWRQDGVGQRPCVSRRPAAADDGVAACGRPAAAGWCQVAAAATTGWRPASAAWRQAAAWRRAWSALSGGLGISASDDVFF